MKSSWIALKWQHLRTGNRTNMWILLFSFLLTAICLHGMQIDFERFEQLSGFNLYNSSLRVRKYNRTLVTLNGTLEIVAPLNKTIVVSIQQTFFLSFRSITVTYRCLFLFGRDRSRRTSFTAAAAISSIIIIRPSFLPVTCATLCPTFTKATMSTSRI